MLLKADKPISFKPSLSVISLSFSQPEKASYSIFSSVFGRLILVRNLQSLKEASPISVIPSGIVISVKPLQYEQMLSGILFLPSEKVIFLRLVLIPSQ